MIPQTLPRSAKREIKVLFLGGGGTPTSGGDAVVDTLLRQWYGSSNVLYKTGSASVTADADGRDLLVVSSTLGSNTVRGKFNTHPIGILNWEEALMRNSPGDFSLTTSSDKTSGQTQINIIDNTHPITAGFTLGNVTVTSSGQIYSHDTNGALGAGVSRLANLTSNPLNAAIYVIEEGGTLANGLAAAGRRVMFFLENSTANAFTANGIALLRSGCDWAGGLS